MISIVVPVYNVSEYIQKCLTALDNQNFDDYEVIVVDDGSTDGSSQLVDTFCAGKDKFKVYHKANGGLMSAWMEGVRHVEGDYVGFVDSDDYPDEKMFEKMYRVAKEHDVDIVYCDYYAMREDRTDITTTDEHILKDGLYTGEEMNYIRNMIFPSLSGQCISNARWNKIFRTSLFVPNTKYCECLSRTFEDRYIVPACMFSAESFYYLKEPLYYYLHRQGSNCGKPSKTLYEDIKRMNEFQRLALEDKGLIEQYLGKWEEARLDSVKQFIKRNVVGYGSLKLAVDSAKEVLNDKEYRTLIKKYKSELNKNGKLSRLLVKSSELHFPLLLVAGRLVTKGRSMQ